jgi:hypothetical protein
MQPSCSVAEGTVPVYKHSDGRVSKKSKFGHLRGESGDWLKDSQNQWSEEVEYRKAMGYQLA